MNEFHGIPLNAISKGRSLDEVLEEYMRMWDDAKKAATEPRKEESEIFADTMKVTAYRIYLLGVADGMKEVNA